MSFIEKYLLKSIIGFGLKNRILFLGQIAQPYLQPPRLLTTPPKTFGENKRYNYSVWSMKAVFSAQGNSYVLA